MRTFNFRIAAVLCALGVLASSATVAAEVQALAPVVDPVATQILQQFSVRTENTLEDLLESGQRVDLDISASVIVSRPNKLRAERKDDLIEQIFYYDGNTLTLYNPSDKVYATEPAPPTIEEMLNFAGVSLGLVLPVADLVYRNAFPLLMQDVIFGVVVGKATIGGVKCDHLVFSRRGVDFQVWVADSGQPLPRKYVVTDTGDPARLSITTLIRDWNVTPGIADARFTFVPPQGAKQIAFMPLKTGSSPSR